MMVDDFEVTVYQAMTIIAPRLQAVLKRHHTKLNFDQICEEVVHFVPDFSEDLFKEFRPYELVEGIKDFFDYHKTTAAGIRQEFLQWLKSNWSEFAGYNAQEVIDHIHVKMGLWNEEHPDLKMPKINWIPDYGGHIAPPPLFPAYNQMQHMTAAGQNWPLTGEEVTFTRK
jgi:hypothetical protein